MVTGPMFLVLFSIVAVFFSAAILVFIPGHLGRKAGVRLVSKLFPSWPRVHVGGFVENPVRVGILYIVTYFVVMLVSIGVFGWYALDYDADVPFAFHHLWRIVTNLFLPEQQEIEQRELSEIIPSGVIMISGFFIAGFMRSVFILIWHRLRKGGKHGESPPAGIQ